MSPFEFTVRIVLILSSMAMFLLSLGYAANTSVSAETRNAARLVLIFSLGAVVYFLITLVRNL